MSGSPTVVYLEPDDEVTSVVRRLRTAPPGPVILVAPGRSRATSSVVALRLLAQVSESEGRSVAVVGDALTRSLAADAGLPAYGTLEEARTGAAPAEDAGQVRHASISVVRGPATDDTAPTFAGMAATRTPPPATPSAAPPAPAAVASAGPDETTRERPVVREQEAPAPRRAPSPRPTSRPRARRPAPATRSGGRWMPVALIGALAVLLLVGAVVAGSVLPAATVTIVPRTETIGPVSYTIELPEAEREADVVSATAEVVASGSYEVEESATGTVVLFNWTFFPVEVPAGTFVAAGEQAFATQADVTVPRGRLTGQGTIAAGDVEVAVVAAAPGEAANVPAEAIDTVVNQSVDAQLRGFPENPEPRVLNPQPTSGGAVASGPEFTQADVDAARSALREQLVTRATEAVAAIDGDLVLNTSTGEPSIQVPDGLVGTRDQERAEISGEVAWEVVVADSENVVTEAVNRLHADATLVSAGQTLVEGSEEVEVGEPSLVEGVLTVPVVLHAQAATEVDPDTVVDRIVGRTKAAAEAALADLGQAAITLWPGWVETVPERDWRIDVVIRPPEGGEA